jgi:SpoIID/LytB domain protein
MSQYGAYGMALRGWRHVQILDHFYRGTKVGHVPSLYPDRLRVGLTWSRTRIHLGARSGPVYLRTGSPLGANRFKIPNGYRWSVRPTRTGKFRLENARGRLIARVGGPHRSLYAVYKGAGSRLQISEAGHTYARGYVEFNVYRSGSAWRLRAIAIMTPQDYVYGVGEVPSSWPLEAMEAQAVAARSYGLAVSAKGQHRTDHGHCNCALYPSTWDQVYAGYDKELEGPGWVKAVRATAGQVVLYRGDVALAVYSSSSGGYSESNEYSWFNAPIPYLRAVCDPGDYTAANPNRTWAVRLTGRQIGARLGAYGYHVGTVNGFRSARRTVSGRIIAITVTGRGGSDGRSVRVSGPLFARALGLRTDKVWINDDRNVTGPIRSKYDSLMCAPGLPQTSRKAVPGGAVQRFAQGAIYRSSDNGRTMWSHGPIYAKYTSLHGARGILGFPRSDIQKLPRPAGCSSGRCAREDFKAGRIYLKRPLGPHELHGAVLGYYLGHGGAAGPLGFPTTDVSVTNDGTTATFEHGTVTCSSQGCSSS